MSKFLYITDQDEYADHSFIGPLFQKYLTKHFDINTTFFSNTKNEIEFEEKGRIIIPKKFQNNILEELEKAQINLNQFQFVVIRNNIELLKEVLDKKQNYNFKVEEKEKYPFIKTRDVEITGPVADFGEFAIKQGINYKYLKDFNPWLRDEKLTNTAIKKYIIKIPVL